MTRIRSTNIKYGDSFVLPIEKAKEEKPDSPELIQLKEELRLLNLEVEKAKERKEKILNEAKAEAEKLIQDTNNKIQQENEQLAKQREEEKKAFDEQMAQEAEKIRAESYQTGYDDGYKQGYVVITNELEEKVHAVDDFAKAQFDLKGNIIKSSELDIINLVLEIAKKVCTESIKFNPEIIKVLTENAIKELKDKEEITIIVNPKLLDILNSISDRLKEDIPQLQNIKIIEDNAVSADGVIVESVLTRVDSRVKSQISEIAEKLFESYNSEDEEFENYIASLEEPDMDAFENIELSDDANITEFLNELEDIPSYDDKLRDEDAEYYSNLDLKELEEETPSTQQEQNNVNDINLDDLENIFNENGEVENVGNSVDEGFTSTEVENVETPQSQETFEPKNVEIQPESVIEDVQEGPQIDEKELQHEAQLQPELEKTPEELISEEEKIYDENVQDDGMPKNISQEDEEIIEKSIEDVEKVEEEYEKDVKPFTFEALDDNSEVINDIQDDIDLKSKLDKLSPMDDNDINL